MDNVTITTIKFPEINLKQRDAHKLRGYFGELFKEHSPLLHNHLEDGNYNYQYPLVQYKVINKTPLLVGLNEGSKLMVDLFLKIKELQINGKTYPVYEKNILQNHHKVKVNDELYQYDWETFWMALNQENYKTYKDLPEDEQNKKLESILKGNILTFCKAINDKVEDVIMVKSDLKERIAHFKNNRMTVFGGSFVTNVSLPDHIGLGKAVSRGFGTVKKR